MCQWAHYGTERWQDRVYNWVRGADCDAWAVQMRSVDTVAHAREWLADLGRIDPKEADRQFERWIASFDAEGIIGLGTGFVVLHKRTMGTPWFASDEIGLEPADNAGDAIVRIFHSKEWLRDHVEAGSILDTRWQATEHLRLETTAERSGISWNAKRRVLRQGEGFRFAIPVTDDLADLVVRADGTRTLRQILDEQLRPRGWDSSRYADPVELSFRQLADRGFVSPVVEATGIQPISHPHLGA
jgi:hypothetical protein